MCGLVGIAGNTNQKHLKMFRDMLIFDMVRGMDSTGVAAVGPASNKATIEKDIGGPDNLWAYGSKLFDGRGISRSYNKVLIGHNRAATIGKVTVENAHPFNFDHITGVHNGSLYWWDDLEKDEKGVEFDVDSKAIFATIAAKGIDHCWDSFWGAAALVWWDEKQETLNFIRNKERPLWFAYSEKEDVIFWASESWMIDIAAKRHDVKLAEWEMEKTTADNRVIKYRTKFPELPTETLTSYKIKPRGYELVEERELEKKLSTRPVRATTTNSSTGTFPRTTTGNLNPTLSPNHRFPSDWAKGKTKAPKEIRGTTFRYQRLVHSTTNGVYKPFVVGEIDSKKGATRVEIYPSTQGQLDKFINDNVVFNQRYRMNCRPRELNDQFGKPWGYRISLDQISLVELVREDRGYFEAIQRQFNNNITHLPTFLLPNGQKGNAVEWRQKVKQVGGCCSWCGITLFTADAPTTKWIDDGAILCGDCVEDGTYQQYISAMA